jgi:hypothetical protein
MIEPKYDLVEKAGGGEARYVGLVATRYAKPSSGAARVVVHVLPQMLDYVADPAALRTLKAGLSLGEARAAGLALVIQRAAAELAEMAAQRAPHAPMAPMSRLDGVLGGGVVVSDAAQEAIARAATAAAGAALVG